MIAVAGREMNWIVSMARIETFCLRQMQQGPAPLLRGPGLGLAAGVAYFTSTARLSAIFCFQIAGPVMCTDSPWVSTATVTGMSLTSNS